MTVPTSPDAVEVVVPLHAEDFSVEHRKVERRVRVNVETISHEHLVDEPLVQERIEVERVMIGKPIDAAPPVRQEGDTTIISVVEEVLVTERRLVLKEEIRLRRVTTVERHQATVTLREQRAVIERIGADEYDANGRDDNDQVMNSTPDLAPIPKPQAMKEE